MIATIRKGYCIELDDGRKFEVEGNRTMRGRYYYLCREKSGRVVSIHRPDLLEAQKEGSARVYLPN